MSSSGAPQWQRLGSNDEFPIVFVMQLRHYATANTNMLLAATLGRGVWTMFDVRRCILYIVLFSVLAVPFFIFKFLLRALY
jgi:hypothetical protein